MGALQQWSSLICRRVITGGSRLFFRSHIIYLSGQAQLMRKRFALKKPRAFPSTNASSLHPSVFLTLS